MRGLPYRGKLTRARELAKDIGRIHSANDYFMVDGVYRYDVRQIRNAHSETQASFRETNWRKIPNDKFLKMHDSFENYNTTKVLTDP